VGVSLAASGFARRLRGFTAAQRPAAQTLCRKLIVGATLSAVKPAQISVGRCGSKLLALCIAKLTPIAWVGPGLLPAG
jgi:hypothetical protein